jgi:hypothetical protein
VVGQCERVRPTAGGRTLLAQLLQLAAAGSQPLRLQLLQPLHLIELAAVLYSLACLPPHLLQQAASAAALPAASARLLLHWEARLTSWPFQRRHQCPPPAVPLVQTLDCQLLLQGHRRGKQLVLMSVS